MKIHTKYIEKKDFEALEKGVRTFDVVHESRSDKLKYEYEYEEGDLIQFQIQTYNANCLYELTTMGSLYQITYILRGQVELSKDYAIVSLKKVELTSYKEKSSPYPFALCDAVKTTSVPCSTAEDSKHN